MNREVDIRLGYHKSMIMVLLWQGVLMSHLCNHVSAAPQKTDREKAGLIGAVQTVVAKGSTILTTDKYDLAGNLTEHVLSTIDNRESFPTLRFVYTYDAEGKRAMEEVYNRDGSRDTRNVYSHDANGQVTAQVSASADGVFHGANFLRYDAKGRVIEEILYNEVPDFSQRWSYTYDEQGNKIKALSHSKDGGIQHEWRFTYDTTGHRTQERMYTSDGHQLSTILYMYDNRGNVIEEKSYSAEGGDTGNIVSTYEYDSTGNWVKKTNTFGETIDGKLKPKDTQIQQRTIIYFSCTAGSLVNLPCR